MDQFRQGDVFIERLETVPTRLSYAFERDADDRVILALGEATGHAHAIADAGAALHVIEQSSDHLLIVTAPDGVRLEHEEHGALRLAPGAYLVRRQVEYHPERVRQVGD